MEKIKEYYPSLVTEEYVLGQFYMFNRDNNIKAKKISDEHKKYIAEAKGGFAKDDGRGGFALDTTKVKATKGGFMLDDGTKIDSIGGGFTLDDGAIISERAAFEGFANKVKRYGHYSYEPGRVIGVNTEDSKIYIQFSDTADDYCHIFRTGIPSDRFDILDKLIQANGK